MRIEWNKVTWYSKILAIVVFFGAFGAGIYIGMQYQSAADIVGSLRVSPRVAPDAPRLIGGDKDTHGCLIAAGYSWCVAKQKCLRPWEEACTATSTPVSAATSVSSAPVRCGGFIRNAPTCSAGYHCKLNAVPDAGGVCVRD